MMEARNEMHISFSAISENEGFARTVVAAFISGLNPTVAELMEVKTAVSEAVTNAIIHGYDSKGGDKTVGLICRQYREQGGCKLYIEVVDHGVGIPDIEQAMEPLYTSKPEQERSGMGFAVMDSFMDSVEVISAEGCGTTVVMTKILTL